MIMTNKILKEGLEYMDMENEMFPILGIDEFKSKLGDDEDIVTLNFVVRSKQAGEDLTLWLERGYEFILDAEVSPGEIEPGKYYVFAELNRRPSIPRKIIEIVDDLRTLTGKEIKDWTFKINKKKHPASKEIIENLIPLTANKYKNEDEKDLNEWRQIAGISTVATYDNDSEIKNLQRMARII
jgi:hypothetical protein